MLLHAGRTGVSRRWRHRCQSHAQSPQNQYNPSARGCWPFPMRQRRRQQRRCLLRTLQPRIGLRRRAAPTIAPAAQTPAPRGLVAGARYVLQMPREVPLEHPKENPTMVICRGAIIPACTQHGSVVRMLNNGTIIPPFRAWAPWSICREAEPSAVGPSGDARSCGCKPGCGCVASALVVDSMPATHMRLHSLAVSILASVLCDIRLWDANGAFRKERAATMDGRGVPVSCCTSRLLTSVESVLFCEM
jgi:hypothetical protein